MDEAISLLTRAAAVSTTEKNKADAHYSLGLLLQRACPHQFGVSCTCSCGSGKCFLAQAITAFDTAVLEDPSHHRAALRARLVRGEAANMDSLPAEWVQDEYDVAFAKQFERKLLGGLAYTSHSELAASVAAAHPTLKGVCLDVGCGTGLCGRLLRPQVGWLIGVDLAPAMASAAAASAVYDDVILADATAVVRAARPGSVSVVAAADVAVYIGDLAPLIEASACALTDSVGLLAFTVEETNTFAPGGCALHRLGGHVLNPTTGRFQHCTTCTKMLVIDASNAVLDVVDVRQFVGRRECGVEVHHATIIARKR